MKSKLRMEMDWDCNRPCIRLESPFKSSDDVRDDLFRIFLQKIEHGFFFVTPGYNYYTNEAGEQIQCIRIYSVSHDELDDVIRKAFHDKEVKDISGAIIAILKPEWVKQQEEKLLRTP